MKNTKDESSIEAYSADWLLEQEFPDISFIVEGILPEGLTVLAGPPKIGKSWLALQLGIAVASGSEFLSEYPVTMREVLLAALEDGQRRMQKRISDLLGSTKENGPSGLHVTHTLQSIGSKLIEDLKMWMKQHPNTGLIVIDTLARVQPSTTNRNQYHHDTQVMGLLQEFSLGHHVALLVVHHVRKQIQGLTGQDFLEEVSGTAGITGSADGVFVLRRQRTQADAELLITGRDIEEQELALEFQDGIWSVKGEAEKYRNSPERLAIIEHLEKAADGMTPKDMADALGKNHQTIKNLMWKMAKNRDIVSGEGGRYRLPNA